MVSAIKTLYRSFEDQALHYFTRPHTQIPDGPIASSAHWIGADMRERQHEWCVDLDAEQIDELSSAADVLIKAGVPMGEVTRDNFALPTLGAMAEGWRAEIAAGRGFVVVRGLPVQDWGEEKSSYMFWGLGHHLGSPGAQNASEELLGHVRDYGESDAPMTRQYRTAGNINFHCDAADVVGLLCLQNAKEGGQSRIVSSLTVFNRLYEAQPELVPRLFEPFALDRRNEANAEMGAWLPIQPCCYDADGVLRTFYHSEYFRSAERHADVDIDEAGEKLLDAYDALCMDPDLHLDMWLQPGDMQFISNHSIAHARTGYTDWPEGARKRHLLRLWLSI